MVAIISMLLLVTLNLAFGAETGMKIAVTNRGLDYANQIVRTELRNILQTVNIPDQSGRDGSTSWNLRNIRVNSISGPDTRISLNPRANGVTLDVFNFGTTLHADWDAVYWFIFKFSPRGAVNLSVSRASLTVVAALGNNQGRPSVTVQSCSCRIDDIGIDFSGGLAAFILNMFKGTVRDKIRTMLQNKVCEVVNTQVITRAREELGKMKLSVDIVGGITLDYSLARSPTVTGNYIEVASRGEFYWKYNRRASPFTAAALPALNEFNRMVYVYATEYSANTLLYVAHVNGLLKYNMTLDNLPVDGLDVLNATGQLKDQYPESTLELHITSYSSPSVKFNNQKLTIAAVANVRVVVHSQTGEVIPLELRVSASVTIQPSIVDGKLIASLADYTFNATIIKSDVGEINVHIEQQSKLEQEFNTLIREAIDAMIVPKINDIGKQGIDLPVTGIFRLYNTQLNVQTGYLQVSSDVAYQKQTTFG